MQTSIRRGGERRTETQRESDSTAVEEGADYLVAGNIHATPSDPGRPGMGLGLIETLASLGRPVIAIGGITPANVWDVKHAGSMKVRPIYWLRMIPIA